MAITPANMRELFEADEKDKISKLVEYLEAGIRSRYWQFDNSEVIYVSTERNTDYSDFVAERAFYEFQKAGWNVKLEKKVEEGEQNRSYWFTFARPENHKSTKTPQ